MYSDLHKYFLQFILEHSYVSTDKAIQFCSNCSDKIDSLNDLKTLISEINQKISKQELKIVLSTCEVTGAVNIALLNTANDDISKQQIAFTPAELEYFQYLLKEIITADDHRLQNIACFNVSDSLTNTLRKDNVEKFLNKCVREGYLVEKDSYVYLGPRCILEFTPYFRIHCKDYYTSCDLCSEPVFTGKVCSSCDKMLHNHCIEKWLTKQNKCPNCKSTWKEADHGVDVEMHEQNESSDDEDQPVSRRAPSQRKVRRL